MALTEIDGGRLCYELRHPWRDGTTHVLFEPEELIERLAVLVPRPRVHQVVYHGILASAARRRPEVVLAATPPRAGRVCAGRVAGSGAAGKTRELRPRYYDWPELMKRVWAVDVLECPRCQHRLLVLAAIHPPEATRAILECLGLPSRAPPVAPARLDVPESAEFGDDWAEPA